jgi:chromosome segregation protein
VHFQRLRLAGFKSFVEPTEFRIEPGLTGIVGPNGCGKSNLLEALRWVMGANSAKAMRAGGMDDVIFAGAGQPARAQPRRGLADHRQRRPSRPGGVQRPPGDRGGPADRQGRGLDLPHQRPRGARPRRPAAVRRRLDRRQLAGPGAPGQISELIAAKPQNRRLILEEAAGVSGLHSRRHEAELRLRAAEANLARLDDVAQELEANLGRLKREARAAERYKKLSAEIRALQGAVLYAKWAEARRGRTADRRDRAAIRAVEETARAAARHHPRRGRRGGAEAAARGRDRSPRPSCTSWPSTRTGWTARRRRTPPSSPRSPATWSASTPTPRARRTSPRTRWPPWSGWPATSPPWRA